MIDEFGEGRNPASRLLTAATDFWTQGMEAWSSAARTAGAGRYSQPGMMADAAEQAGDVAQVMARAWLVAMASTGRYSRAVSEVYVKYQGAVTQAVVDRVSGQAPPIEDCRVLADELRALLREIGDAAMLEARRLQIEFEALGEEVARAADAATSAASGPDPQPRRHQVKP